MHLTLAIDQGTHASRAIIFDEHGCTIGEHLEHIMLATPESGHVEQDSARVLETTQTCIGTVLDTLSRVQRRSVNACGISTQRSSVLAWRKNGEPLSPVISWQDTRTASSVSQLDDKAAEIHRISGLPLSAHYGASKLHWLQQMYADSQEFRSGPLASYLLHQLVAGNPWRVDHSNAQRMQLLDIETLSWSPALCDLFDVAETTLPVCCPVQEHYGELACSGIPVTAVCGDQNAAWFGDGTAHQDAALINIGSGAFVLAPQAKGKRDSHLLTSIACSGQQQTEYLLEATINGAGNALSWLRNKCGITFESSQLDRYMRLSQSPALFINTVGGLGAPWWNPGITPVFVNGIDKHRHEDLITGVVESILFMIHHNLERIRRIQPIERVYVSGGLSSSDTLCQKLANLCTLPLDRSDIREASARGAAWLAAGRPADWHSENDLQSFEPQTDTRLTDRYHAFIEQLELKLQNHE